MEQPSVQTQIVITLDDVWHSTTVVSTMAVVKIILEELVPTNHTIELNPIDPLESE